MSKQTITIELPAISAHDAQEAASRVAMLDTYTQLIKARMGLAPSEAQQPAALLAATHGLNNELGGIIASLAQPGSTSAVSGAATAMICNAITAAADQLAGALRDVGLDIEKALEAVAAAIKTAGDEAEWAGRHVKEGAEAISVSLDNIAHDVRNTTAEVIYARVDEALKQRNMAAPASPRRTAKSRCK